MLKGDSSVQVKKGVVRGDEDLRGDLGTSTFITRRGLRLPNRMPFEKWMGIGTYLSSIMSGSSWCLGDWLVYGESAFTGRYRDAIELTSLDYQTLRNHAWVARRFPMSRRRDRLSFTHHAEVAALAEHEQDFWLLKAEQNAWSAKRLRREVRASLLERDTSEDQTPGEVQNIRLLKVRTGEPAGASSTKGTVSFNVSVPPDCLEFCRATASRLGLNLDSWVAQVLVAVAEATGERSELQLPQ
ncbi:LmbU family transcriptional regulator [Streptomyces mirabilis]|uniref:LmbU family transcriptional regulator n=1 Tax=Streptomyces mirabilis TaxID=68239 RepID=UPI0036B92400